jgi:hypothetical protein
LQLRALLQSSGLRHDPCPQRGRFCVVLEQYLF